MKSTITSTRAMVSVNLGEPRKWVWAVNPTAFGSDEANHRLPAADSPAPQIYGACDRRTRRQLFWHDFSLYDDEETETKIEIGRNQTTGNRFTGTKKQKKRNTLLRRIVWSTSPSGRNNCSRGYLSASYLKAWRTAYNYHRPVARYEWWIVVGRFNVVLKWCRRHLGRGQLRIRLEGGGWPCCVGYGKYRIEWESFKGRPYPLPLTEYYLTSDVTGQLLPPRKSPCQRPHNGSNQPVKTSLRL